MVDNPTVRVRRVYDERTRTPEPVSSWTGCGPAACPKPVPGWTNGIQQWPHQRACEPGTTTNRNGFCGRSAPINTMCVSRRAPW